MYCMQAKVLLTRLFGNMFRIGKMYKFPLLHAHAVLFAAAMNIFHIVVVIAAMLKCIVFVGNLVFHVS